MKYYSQPEDSEYIDQTLSELREFGITYFSYGLINQGRLMNSFFSNSEWGKIYRDNGYSRLDPLYNGVFFSNIPLIFWEALHAYGDEQHIMAKRFEVCSIRSGLTLGLKNDQSTEILALGATLSPKELYSLINEEATMARLRSILYHFYGAHQNAIRLQ